MGATGSKPDGMHITAIRNFLNEHPEIKAQNMTTSEVNRHVVKKETKLEDTKTTDSEEGESEARGPDQSLFESKDSNPMEGPYIKWYNKRKDSETGKAFVAPATVFVSHAWKYQFYNVVVDVMEQYAEKHPDTYFWFDLFTNAQHRDPESDPKLSMEWYKDTFKKGIESIGKVLLILSPWANPQPLGRAWCLFEIAHAFDNKKASLEINLPKSEAKSMEETARKHGNSLFEALAMLDAEQATAKNMKDKTMIFGVIREFEGGFYKLNMQVKNKLRYWYLEAIKRKAESKPDNAEFLLTGADVLKDLGEIDKASKYIDKCQALIEAKPSTSTQEFKRDAKLTAAIIYGMKGDKNQALKLNEELIKEFTEMEKPSYRDRLRVAKAYSNKAGIYRLQRKIGESLKNHDEAKEIRDQIVREKRDGVETGAKGEEESQDIDPVADEAYIGVGASLLSMGNVYVETMELVKAIGNYAQTLTIYIRKKQGGGNHPHVGVCYSNIGNTYYYQGKWDKCIEMQEQSLRIKRLSVGNSHQEVARSLNNKARALCGKGDYEGAMTIHEEAYSMQRKLLGDYHADVAETERYLADVHAKRGNNFKARWKYGLIIRQASDPDHPDIATVHHAMGEMYYKQGDFADSTKHHERALEIRKSYFGDQHPLVAMSNDNLALLATKKKIDERESKEVLKTVEESLNIKQDRLGEYHPSVLDSYCILSEVYKVMGDKKKEESALEIKRLLETESNALEKAQNHIENAAALRQQELHKMVNDKHIDEFQERNNPQKEEEERLAKLYRAVENDNMIQQLYEIIQSFYCTIGESEHAVEILKHNFTPLSKDFKEDSELKSVIEHLKIAIANKTLRKGDQNKGVVELHTVMERVESYRENSLSDVNA